MQLKFENIEKIHNLLTTNEWIERNDPNKRLEKLRSDLEKVTDPKERVKLERAISGVEKSLASGKAPEFTLEKAQISNNDGEILLANIHLLYSNEVKPESKEKLEELLRNNFDKLNSSDVYKKANKVNLNQNNNKPKNLVNEKLYEQVLPYCKIISNIYTENGGLQFNEMAKKLSTYFADFDDAKNYLNTVDYSTKETIELSFQYNLPVDLSVDTLKFWQDLNKSVPKVGRDSLQLFSNANLLEKNEKFQELLSDNKEFLSSKEYNDFVSGNNKQADFQKQVKENIKTITDILNKIVIKEAYKYNKEELSEENRIYAKNLAYTALQGKLDNKSFNKALDFIKEGNLKKIDKIPELNFNVEVNGKKYNFAKLPADDMRGFMLGKFSNSCQSIGDHSEKCVLDGMSRANAGFYIITDEKGKIKAQSYAWLAGENDGKATAIVLDSFEHLGQEDKRLFAPVMNKLREELKQEELELYVGSGGGTPNINIATQPHPEPVEKNLYIYDDVRNVYPITKKLPELDLNKKIYAGLDIKYNSFEELKKNNRLIDVIKLIDAGYGLNSNLIESLAKNKFFDPRLFLNAKNKEAAQMLIDSYRDRQNSLDFLASLPQANEIASKLIEDRDNNIKLMFEGNNMQKLIELGLEGDEILNAFNDSREKWSKFTHNETIQSLEWLSKSGISTKSLWEAPLTKSRLFLNYRFNFYSIDDFTKAVDISKLWGIYDEEPEKVTSIIKSGDKIAELINTKVITENQLFKWDNDTLKSFLETASKITDREDLKKLGETLNLKLDMKSLHTHSGSAKKLDNYIRR